MSANYVVSRIKEALYNAKGNKAKAKQQIMAWARTDVQLLEGLTRAHLSGIVDFNINRVESGKGLPSAAAPSRGSAPKKAKRKMVNPAKGSAFGQEILKTVSSGNATVFGLESYESPNPPSKDNAASQRHVDALNHIASFSGNKVN